MRIGAVAVAIAVAVVLYGLSRPSAVGPVAEIDIATPPTGAPPAPPAEAAPSGQAPSAVTVDRAGGSPATVATPATEPRPAPGERAKAAIVVPAVPPPTDTGPAGIVPVVDDAALVEAGAHGPLPRIAADGRQPWRVYARPADGRDDRPRVVVIVAGLGLSDAATETALRRLPPAVTLAFDPYGRVSASWAARARGAGHEILMAVPLESDDPAFDDAGPKALLTSLPWPANADRLDFLLSRATGYAGIITVGGSRFARRDTGVQALLRVTRRRGLMVVDGVQSEASRIGRLAAELAVPRASVDVLLDEQLNPQAVDDALARLASAARSRAIAVALARPYPVTVDRIVAWAATLDDQGLVLVPVSAVADRQVMP